MRFRNAALLMAMCTVAILFCLQGCADETPEMIGPMTGGPHSNTTISGYTRAGVTFGR
jgi:hypothetical protein